MPKSTVVIGPVEETHPLVVFKGRASPEWLSRLVSLTEGQSFVIAGIRAPAVYAGARRRGVRISLRVEPGGGYRVWRRFATEVAPQATQEV